MKDRKLCYFFTHKYQNGCALIDDQYRCEPERCVWFRTHEDMLNSYVRAVELYNKNHKGDVNWQKQKIVPEDWAPEVRRRLKCNKTARNETKRG